MNPSGGGLRTLYASQYLVPKEMAWKAPSDSIMARIDPEISKGVLIGTDFRMLHRYSDDDQPQTNFFAMQGDIYLDFQMDPNLSLYFDKGISSSYEIFGMWQGLPLTGYVKAGRFVPAYDGVSTTTQCTCAASSASCRRRTATWVSSSGCRPDEATFRSRS
jgi:hypothetical protein